MHVNARTDNSYSEVQRSGELGGVHCCACVTGRGHHNGSVCTCVCECVCVCVCPSICKQVQYLYVDNHGPVNLSLGSLMLPMLFLSSFCDDIITRQERCGLHQTTPRPLLL